MEPAFDPGMRTLVIALLLGIAAVGHAAPCIVVSAPDRDDAIALRRVLAAALPVTPRTCIDVEVIAVRRSETPTDATIAAQLRVLISQDGGHVEAMLVASATAHVPRTASGARLAVYRRDAF